MSPQDALRRLPAVHVLIEQPSLAPLVGRHGRDAVVIAARATLELAREALRRGGGAPELEALATAVQGRLERRPTLYRRVLNATGVVLHTNLGRAPLPESALAAMREAAGNCDLEFDLEAGARASRHRDVEPVLTAVTGAEAGLVVNNNAAAVMLAVTALSEGKATIISRGQLVEIGGGFRLPTILAATGSPLREIGTTNRTHLADYEQAMASGAGVVLVVHRSNFVMRGYVSEPNNAELVAACRRAGVPVVLDLGSGALFDPRDVGLPAETTVQQALREGFDLVCFSGDKLMGGPQGGLIVGRGDLVAKLRAHPLMRAVRCDKTQLAGIVATLALYQRGEHMAAVPIWRMLRTDTATRAHAWQRELGIGEVLETADAFGGGSLPEESIKGHALALRVDDVDATARRLRLGEPAVVGHIVDGRLLLHPRTVEPDDDATLVECVRRALASNGDS